MLQNGRKGKGRCERQITVRKKENESKEKEKSRKSFKKDRKGMNTFNRKRKPGRALKGQEAYEYF